MHACLGNSFRVQGRLHHGMHEAIVQRRIVVVFKHTRIDVIRPSRFLPPAPASRRSGLLSYRSPKHPYSSQSNYGFGVLGCGLSVTTTQPKSVSSGGLVLGEFIFFIIVPPSESAESSSDQSGYQSEDSPYYDSDNVNPEAPWEGYGYWHSR